jgi:uncharacterized protein (DUF1330 family)
MSCYFIAQIKIHDADEYQKYLENVDEVFSKFNGTYLAVDTNPTVLEGTWSRGRVVLIQFPNESDLRRWYDSPEYQSILKHRLKAADCDSILVKGMN